MAVAAADKTMGADRHGPVAVLPVAVLVAALLAVTWPELKALAGIWKDDEVYSHGPLVVVVFLYFVWRRRHRLTVWSPDPIGVLLVLAATTVYAATVLVGISFATYAMLPLMLLGVFVAVLGRGGGAALLAPTAYLYLALPLWSHLTGPLQALATRVVTAMVAATGIPAFIQGNFIYVPSGKFVIADGCAGTGTFVASIALASFIAMLNRSGLRRGAVLVAAAVTLAVVGNWVRVYSLVLVGHLTEMRHSLIVDGHATFSWMLFAVFMIPVFWFGTRAAGGEGRRPDSAPAVAGRRSSRSLVLIVAATLAAMLSPIGVEKALASKARQFPAEFQVAWPSSVGDWRLTPDTAAWQPYFHNVDFLSTARYVSGATRAHAYFAGYGYQEQGKEADYFGNRFFPGNWVVGGTRRLETDAGVFRLLELVSENGSESIVVYRYVSGRIATVSQSFLKLASLWNVSTGYPGAGVEGIWVECSARCDASGDNIASLAGQLFRSRT